MYEIPIYLASLSIINIFIIIKYIKWLRETVDCKYLIISSRAEPTHKEINYQ